MDSITIKVTEDHIKNAVRKHTHCCPIALAVRDIIPDNEVSVCVPLCSPRVYVYIDEVPFYLKNQTVHDMIEKWDANKGEFTPMELTFTKEL